jgi:hypothetical protein
VGNDYILFKNALLIIAVAENTPIVVSIASSGTPKPVQTYPVVVLKLSTYG